jgi:hypothetical protein
LGNIKIVLGNCYRKYKPLGFFLIQEDEDEEGDEGTEDGAVEIHVIKPPLPHPANLLEVCSI